MTRAETDWLVLLLTNAWPWVTLIGLFLLRQQIGQFFEALGGLVKGTRNLKLGFAGISVELGAAASEERVRTDAIADLPFAAEPGMMRSSGRSNIESAIKGTPVEAVTVDLKSGRGRGFITSRLFVMTELMARQRDVKVVAFVHDSGVQESQYLGACLVGDLRRALVQAFPEYEAAYHLAVHQQWWVPSGPAAAVVPGPWPAAALDSNLPQLDGLARFSEEAAAGIFGATLQSLQTHPVAGAPAHVEGWVALPQNILERGEWVTASWLRSALGGALMEERVQPGPDAVNRALQCSNPYVGLVDDSGHLIELISRNRLLDRAVKLLLVSKS